MINKMPPLMQQPNIICSSLLRPSVRQAVKPNVFKYRSYKGGSPRYYSASSEARFNTSSARRRTNTILGGALLLGSVTGFYIKTGQHISLESEIGALDSISQSGQNALTKLSTLELLSSLFVYESITRPFIIKISTTFINLCNSLGISFIYRLPVKKTVYNRFCGGETADDVTKTIEGLSENDIKTILGYSVEANIGEGDQDSIKKGIQKNFEGHVQALNVAKKLENNVVAIKITGLINPQALLTISDCMKEDIQSAQVNLDKLEGYVQGLYNQGKISKECQADILEAYDYTRQICEKATKDKVKIIVDAEQTYFHPGIDLFALDMQRKFNTPGDPYIYNTYQMYLKLTKDKVHEHLKKAQQGNYSLGVKLVRGAYILSEPPENRHLFHDTKKDTDDAYNKMVKNLITACDEYPELSKTSYGIFITSHNKETVIRALSLLRDKKNIKPNTPVYFGQLYGMSDDLTNYITNKLHEIAKQNDKIYAYKYLPFGKLEEMMPYLFRRVEENSLVIERAKDERASIRKEVRRRFWFW